MNQSFSRREIEYSKLWAKNNPGLFSESILEFFEQHPSDYWNFEIEQTGGFITLRGNLK